MVLIVHGLVDKYGYMYNDVLYIAYSNDFVCE